MRVPHMLVLAVLPMLCVTTSVLAQTTITYGTPRIVQETPVTANYPDLGTTEAPTAAGGQETVVTQLPMTPDVAAPYTSSAPVTTYYPPAAPVTAYQPVAPRGAVINYRPFIPATQIDLSPQPVVSYRPVVAGVAPVVAYRPVVAAPVVAYRPVAAAPVVTYRPVVPGYGSPVAAYYPPTAVGAYPVGPTITVRPKVYVSGQPIRNLLRAITP